MTELFIFILWFPSTVLVFIGHKTYGSLVFQSQTCVKDFEKLKMEIKKFGRKFPRL